MSDTCEETLHTSGRSLECRHTSVLFLEYSTDIQNVSEEVEPKFVVIRSLQCLSETWLAVLKRNKPQEAVYFSRAVIHGLNSVIKIV